MDPDAVHHNGRLHLAGYDEAALAAAIKER
jgi:hypothetical protein